MSCHLPSPHSLPACTMLSRCQCILQVTTAGSAAAPQRLDSSAFPRTQNSACCRDASSLNTIPCTFKLLPPPPKNKKRSLESAAAPEAAAPASPRPQQEQRGLYIRGLLRFSCVPPLLSLPSPLELASPPPPLAKTKQRQPNCVASASDLMFGFGAWANRLRRRAPRNERRVGPFF